MSSKTFRDMHINFANQMQWLEPLLLTAYFSCDDKAVGTTEKRARGSFRVLRIAWGNFAGSNVENFKKGIGRYANINTYWRDNFNFYEKDKLKPCIKPSPYAAPASIGWEKIPLILPLDKDLPTTESLGLSGSASQ